MKKVRVTRKSKFVFTALIATTAFSFMFNQAHSFSSGDIPIPDLCPGSGVTCQVSGIPGIPGGSQKDKDKGAVVIHF